MSDFFLTAPDGSFTITQAEAAKTFELYDLAGWEHIELGLPADAVDVHGVKIDRHNSNVKVYVMASLLMSVRYGIDASVGRADEFLSRNEYFEPLIMSMISVFEKHKAGDTRG